MHKYILSNIRKSSVILTSFFTVVILLGLMAINVGAFTVFLLPLDDFERTPSNNLDNGWTEIEDNPGDISLKTSSGEKYASLKGGGDVTAMTHELSSGGEFNAILSFRWRGDKNVSENESDALLVILGEPDDAELVSLSLSQNCDTEEGETCNWNDEEISLDSDICEDGGLLTFQTTANSASETVSIDDVSVTCEGEEEANGSISGYKWYDVDGDGIKEDDEPVLRNWPIHLSNGDNTETDNEGYYEFSELSSGDYTVCESLPENWFQTYPNDNVENAIGCTGEEEDFGQWGHEVTLENGEDTVENLNFGNSFKLSAIQAFKFNDLNGNSEWEQSEEPPIEGWQICLYLDDFSEDISNFFEPWDFFFNNGFEQCKLTNASGQVEWLSLYPGEYDVWENNVWGWEVTTDENYELEIDFNEDQTFYFGNQLEDPSTVRAFKFSDLNKNGDWDDEEEEPVQGWEICLYMWPWFGDAEDYELLSCKFTDESGWVEWIDLTPGEYYIEEIMQRGWEPTTDVAENGEEFELDTDSEEEFWFGNWSFGEPASLRVFKFYDLNQNGIWDWEDLNDNETWNWGEGEMLISGWQICITNNFEESEGEFFYDESDCQQTNETGWVEWNNLQSDVYLVFEPGVGEEWVNTTGNNYSVVFLGEGGEEKFWFGNFSEPVSIHASKRFIFSQDVPFIGEFNSGNLFDGGSFFDIFAPVSDWEMCLFKNVNKSDWDTLDCKRTDDSGWVWWDNLPSGYYKVEEEQRPSWWQSVFDPVWYGWLNPGEFINNILFLNSSDDSQSPHSEFDNARDHEIINTEIVSLELSGSTTDDVSGPRDVTLKVYNVERGLENSYPVDSFFDVFTEVSCDSGALPSGETIPIEIVSLELTGVEPLTVGWNHNWTPPKAGIYCFEVSATDNAGRVERTDFAGPVAYVPVPQISEEEIVSQPETQDTSVTVTWSTSHPATSRVIYDTVSHGELGNNACPLPNQEFNCYGYAFSTVEDSTLVTSHSVTINDLESGTIYYYRSVSHGSPEAVGDERNFTTENEPVGGNQGGGSGGGGGSGSNPNPPYTPSGGGTSDGGTTTSNEFQNQQSDNSNIQEQINEITSGIVRGVSDSVEEFANNIFTAGKDVPEVVNTEKDDAQTPQAQNSTSSIQAQAGRVSLWIWVTIGLVVLGSGFGYLLLRKFSR